MTKTKIALAIALIAGSASVASAQGFDPNPANRYPSYTAPGGMAQHYIGTSVPGSASRSIASQNVAPRGALQSAPVRLQSAPVRLQSAPVRLQSAPVRLQQGGSAYVGGQFGTYGAQQDEVGVDLRDRASSPFAGGVN